LPARGSNDRRWLADRRRRCRGVPHRLAPSSSGASRRIHGCVIRGSTCAIRLTRLRRRHRAVRRPAKTRVAAVAALGLASVLAASGCGGGPRCELESTPKALLRRGCRAIRDCRLSFDVAYRTPTRHGFSGVPSMRCGGDPRPRR
jgi:hypothetical protein